MLLQFVELLLQVFALFLQLAQLDVVCRALLHLGFESFDGRFQIAVALLQRLELVGGDASGVVGIGKDRLHFLVRLGQVRGTVLLRFEFGLGGGQLSGQFL